MRDHNARRLSRSVSIKRNLLLPSLDLVDNDQLPYSLSSVLELVSTGTSLYLSLSRYKDIWPVDPTLAVVSPNTTLGPLTDGSLLTVSTLMP